jgi:hypothetical protein
VSPAELSFWPSGEDAERQITAIADRTFGGTDAVAERLGSAFAALGGFYGDAAGPRFRFENRLVLPGRLLKTNGTPDRDGSVWLHRDRDLVSGDRLFAAESVDLRDDSLRALGARRDLEPIRLLQLCDLLGERDPEGALRKLLAEAVRSGGLATLRDEAKVPEPLRAVARELADVLDPAIESSPLP